VTFHAHPQRAQHDRDWNNYRAWWKADFRRFFLTYNRRPWKNEAEHMAWGDRVRAQTRRLKVLARREDWQLQQREPTP